MLWAVQCCEGEKGRLTLDAGGVAGLVADTAEAAAVPAEGVVAAHHADAQLRHTLVARRRGSEGRKRRRERERGRERGERERERGQSGGLQSKACTINENKTALNGSAFTHTHTYSSPYLWSVWDVWWDALAQPVG